MILNDIHSLFIHFQKDDFACFWKDHSLCPLKGRNLVLASVCPQVYGLYVVKLAVAMVLAGGVPVCEIVFVIISGMYVFLMRT